MRKILLYKIPSMILLQLLKGPYSVKQISKSLNTPQCHVNNLILRFEEKLIVIREKVNSVNHFSLTDKGKYFAQRVRDIYFYDETIAKEGSK